ncbi:hypothetical protein FV226_27205 [Methylobacterium sp. WL12]|uniref:hypothetical protein n=1 Tax=Methylobacterium sp. WL12 TaxID=2603890 RepID=UPI0011CCDC9E|nr:hypothetical protein [Methylobacterium sp. WL12]TXM63820.1 hypothetical protein FV226_27205 [Methylobacterium sp. WL12]
MRQAATLILLATTALCGTAGAGTIAGAQDGGYRTQDGDFLLVESKDHLIGVQGLDCKNPVVVSGRLRAKNCWANGHLGGDVDVSWRVDGNIIVSEGKRYILSPPLPPIDFVALKAPADPFIGTPDAWEHNRSGVAVDPDKGTIRYLRPRPDLKSVVKTGAVLYEGSLKPGRMIFGTAYAFKDGCKPASYPVRGSYSKHNEVLTLTGPGPVRRGCEVVAYSYDSPHSKLVFEYIVGD